MTAVPKPIYQINRAYAFVAVLAGMAVGTNIVQHFLKPDMTIPDILVDKEVAKREAKAAAAKEAGKTSAP
ncbi:hypothetical protein HDV00_006146 [Rhizophlyctis rosea]|nr:hypothetical protein HDV00_006146 [Rhizophlyctis rosea]